MGARITLYTTQYCGYCAAAKRLLDAKGAAYVEIRVDARAELRAWLLQTTAQRTVPQIFINGRSVGGYTELATLDQRGELDGVQAQPPADDDPVLRT